MGVDGKTILGADALMYRDIGNGDFGRGMEALQELARTMRWARERHPDFAGDEADAYEVISREMEELNWEIHNYGPPIRKRAEAMDVAVTALRFWLGEHLPGGWK